ASNEKCTMEKAILNQRPKKRENVKWSTNYTGFKSVRKLVVKCLLIILHSSDCENSKDITNNSKEKVVKYDLEIIKYFDNKNIVFLKDKIFQDGKLDANSKELQSNRSDKFNKNKIVVNNKIEQDIFDYDSIDLVTDFIKE
ncbi:4122_t:CDS:2, partial [Gigaspora margarita]